jgi:quinol monooxygenase YgiN
VGKKLMIIVIATIEIAEGRRDDFLAEFHRLVPSVRAEEGCIEYGPTVDVASGLSAQGPVRDDVAVIVEKWDDLAALQAHLEAPHMAEYRTRVKEMVKRVSLQVLTPA